MMVFSKAAENMWNPKWLEVKTKISISKRVVNIAQMEWAIMKTLHKQVGRVSGRIRKSASVAYATA